MSEFTKDYFEEAIKNLATRQDVERIEAAIRNANLLALSAADGLHDVSEQLAYVEEALDWNTTEGGALSDKAATENIEDAFK